MLKVKELAKTAGSSILHQVEYSYRHLRQVLPLCIDLECTFDVLNFLKFSENPLPHPSTSNNVLTLSAYLVSGIRCLGVEIGFSRGQISVRPPAALRMSRVEQLLREEETEEAAALRETLHLEVAEMRVPRVR